MALAKLVIQSTLGPLLCLLAWVYLAAPALPVSHYLGGIALAWLGFALTWQSSANWSVSNLAWGFWFGALTWRVLGLTAAPLYENDWARFLWDGWLCAQGSDPYTSVPLEWFANPALPEAMQVVLDQVNHPHLYTVYGPIAQLIFAIAAWVVPGSLMALKGLFLLADLGVVALLQRTVGSRRALLYAWCPLVIQETAFSAHPDVLAIAFMVSAWQLRHRPFYSSLLLALAFATRPHALLLAPFLLWRTRWRGLLSLTVALSILYAPCWLRGHWGEFSHLSQMSGGWHFNDIFRSGLASFLDEAHMNLVASGFFLICAAALFFHWARQNGNPLPPLGLLYGLWWFTSPVANAWYLQFAIPFLAMEKRASVLTWSFIITAPLTYLTGLQLQQQTHPWELLPWVMPCEAAVCTSALLIATWHRKRTAHTHIDLRAPE